MKRSGVGARARLYGNELEVSQWATNLSVGKSATPRWVTSWRSTGCNAAHLMPTGPFKLAREGADHVAAARFGPTSVDTNTVASVVDVEVEAPAAA